jgi:hypothetical protein
MYFMNFMNFTIQRTPRYGRCQQIPLLSLLSLLSLSVPQQDLTPAMFRCYFRFLETLDEYFDYAPSPPPPQGNWKIYGIGLPGEILKQVYHKQHRAVARPDTHLISAREGRLA